MATEVNKRWLHPGFTRDSVLNYLFKKGIHRVDTSLNTAYYQEGFGQNNLFLDYLATDPIPQDVPTDFVALSYAQIATIFQISEAEVSEFNTTLNGTSVFSIEQSTSHPHVLRVNNLLMKPFIGNINSTFTAITSKSRVNLIENTIHTSYGNGGFRLNFKRSGDSGELSSGGTDYLNFQQVAYIFDTDNGILSLHEPDDVRYSPFPIKNTNPPVISCFVYKGSFGRLGWQFKNDALVLNGSQLLLGKSSITNPTLIMDVSGSAFIDDLTVRSVTTYSDMRLKENIEIAPPNNGVLQLNPVFYNYKSRPGAKEYGLIAQEVQKVAPDLVRENEGYLSVQYDRIGVELIPIIRGQQKRIEKLEAQVEALIKHLT